MGSANFKLPPDQASPTFAHISWMGRRKLKLAFSTLMQQIKARSSRHVQIEFPELRKRYWGTLFWARGFFSTTSGNVTDDVILQYLELYSKRETICISL